MTKNPTKFTVFQRTKPMHFLFSHFSAVDLASTEHCCNSPHLLLLLDPQTGLTCVQVLKFRLKPSLNGRRLGAFEADNIFLHFVNSIVYPIILAIQRSSSGKQFFISEENEIYLFMHRLNRFLEHGELHWFFGHSCFTM